MKIKKIPKKARTALGIIRREGAVSFSIKALEKTQKRNKHKIQRNKIALLVKNIDVEQADFRIKPKKYKVIPKKVYTIAWVMSPPGKGSGGHQNIYRFINFLENAGHKCKIYIYSNLDKRNVKEIQAAMGESYENIAAKMEILNNNLTIEPSDALFATGWETAYPVFNIKTTAKKFYFVQDFEPYFYPIGSENILAENTYKFGFYGITAGGWLAKKLKSEYGMDTDHFDFSADRRLYKFSNSKVRKEVFFYARPVTPRRGFEMGIMALDIFHKKHPEYIINLAGWDVSDYDLPFPYKNLQSLSLAELPALYNKCAVALVLSLTNMSLLPLELLSCGTIPVVNDGENNRLVSNNPFIAYAENSPMALAEKMSEIIKRDDLTEYSRLASDSIENTGWEKPGRKFVNIIERELRNG